MKEIRTVFGFTLREALRKKSFIISTIIIIGIIVVGSAIGSAVLSSKTDKLSETVVSSTDGTTSENEEYDWELYIIDGRDTSGSDFASQTANILSQGNYSGVKFIGAQASSEQELRERAADVNAKPAVMLAKIDYLTNEIAYEDGSTPYPYPVITYSYSGGIFTMTPDLDALTKTIGSLYTSALLSGEGVSDRLIGAAVTGAQYSTENLGGVDFTGYILGILMTVLIFMCVYYYGYFVAMSVASEKTSRVMETLIMSAKPGNILIGKCLAMGVAGLLQFSLILISIGASYGAFFADKAAEMGIALSASGLDAGAMMLTVVYFILGYVLFAMLNSVCGAGVSRPEDLNSALMPTMMVAMISFYASYMGIFSAGDGYRRIVSLIPFTAPFIMPYRLLNDTVAPLDIALSAGILIVTIALITWISIKMYTVSVLHYGQRLKIKDLWRMVKNG